MPSPIKTVIPLYASLVMIWALTPLAIVWSVADIPAMWALVLRFCIAAPLIAIVMAVLRIRLPLNRTALHSYVAGSFNLIVSQTFTYLATSYLSSGMIALLFGFAPIMAGVIAFMLYRQRLSGIQWLGMLVALGGLYLNTMTGQDAGLEPIGLLFMFFAILTYTVSIFWVKHVNAKVAPLAQASGSIFISVVIALTYIPFIWSDLPSSPPGAQSLLAISYLVLASSIIAMFCYFNLMQKVSPTTLSLATVITPVLAISFGILLNNEPFRITMVIGTGLVIGGLLLYFYRDLRHMMIKAATPDTQK